MTKAKRNWRNWIREFWSLTKPYWTSEEKWKGIFLLGSVIALSLASVYMTVVFNTWNQQFYDALQRLDAGAFPKLVLRFAILASIFIVVAVYKYYLMQLLQIRWRRWMTANTLGDWMKDRTYYVWQLSHQTTDNPDQRIAEDIREFVSESLSLTIGLFSEIVTLFSFLGILWILSGPIDLPLPGGKSITIPGYLTWVCMIYAFGGTWLTHKIGRPLIFLNFQQQKYEADFRFNLVRLRENSESVAMSKGADTEKRSLLTRFNDVVVNFEAIMNKQKQIIFFQVLYNQVANVFPIFISAPRYFAGQIKLGGLMQIANAFGQVQGSLSYIVQSYSSIARWLSVVDRLAAFNSTMTTAKQLAAQKRDFATLSNDSSKLYVKGLELRLPNNKTLASNLTAEFPKGKSVLISGPSGSGKSTFLRSLAGIWPFIEGKLEVPAGMNAMFLPQKPYLPIDTLRAALTFPDIPSKFSEQEIKQKMRTCNLEEFSNRLDEVQNWALVLSPGEQQRVAFVRVLLHKPDWVFLDESTSALDETTQAALYRALKEHLPGVSIISVAHRASLREFHELYFDFGKKAFI
ncbi:MAG: ABC transporter ATP-binding protein/permease [Bacteriovoracia bacterium]